ncbi:hypothetical protein ACS0TY_017313 [Phlomoides rotata]
MNYLVIRESPLRRLIYQPKCLLEYSPSPSSLIRWKILTNSQTLKGRINMSLVALSLAFFKNMNKSVAVACTSVSSLGGKNF